REFVDVDGHIRIVTRHVHQLDAIIENGGARSVFGQHATPVFHPSENAAATKKPETPCVAPRAGGTANLEHAQHARPWRDDHTLLGVAGELGGLESAVSRPLFARPTDVIKTDALVANDAFNADD